MPTLTSTVREASASKETQPPTPLPSASALPGVRVLPDQVPNAVKGRLKSASK
jgi:hypothetical protein